MSKNHNEKGKNSDLPDSNQRPKDSLQKFPHPPSRVEVGFMNTVKQTNQRIVNPWLGAFSQPGRNSQLYKP
ncbi:hypothetical protein BVC80_9061g62 [Macleaya cordata]|uniref:Uncharacterized protein n=1 Tax=Macleaya cordata TaxID=56857 RepID=A0A200PN53_MACCD|nr:hypothetical protein BVC80_9061g62 [Macleaya cordata]